MTCRQGAAYKFLCSAVSAAHAPSFVKRPLGPLLFIIYLLPFDDIFRKFGIYYHSYASNTQLCLSTKPNQALPPPSLTYCLRKIKSWLSAKLLKLINTDKTEVLLVETKIVQTKVKDSRCALTIFKRLPSRLIIQVLFFKLLKFWSTSILLLSAHFHLRNSWLCPSLTANSTALLVHALVITRVYYCHSIPSVFVCRFLHRLGLKCSRLCH